MGWAKHMPKLRAAVEKAAPGVNAAEIVAIAELYTAELSDKTPKLNAVEIEHYFDNLIHLIVELAVDLKNLPHEIGDAIIIAGAYGEISFDAMRVASTALDRAWRELAIAERRFIDAAHRNDEFKAAKTAATQKKKGGKPPAIERKMLVRRIKRQLEIDGLKVDLREQGPLCLITDAVLEYSGEKDLLQKPGAKAFSIRSVVRNALAD